MPHRLPGPARRRARRAGLVALAAGTLAGTLAGLATPGAAQSRRPPARRPAAGARPWWADTARWDARVVRRVDRDAAPRTLLAGDTVPFPTPALPAALPDSLRRLGVRWGSDDASVASADAGRVVAHRVGTTTVRAWTIAGVTSTVVRVRPAARGVVRDARGEPLAGVVVRVRPAGGDPLAGATDSARTGADGAFLLPLPDREAGGPRAWDVHLTPPDAAPLHPATFRAVPAARAHGLTVVLLPTAWTIRGGSYAGATIPVLPTAALEPTTDGSRFWRLAGSLAGTTASRQGTPVGWDAPFPLRVAMRAQDDDADNQATLARHLAAFNTAWGAEAVRLAPADSAQILVRLDPEVREAGFTDAGWSGDAAELASALVVLRGRAGLQNARVVHHELLHALGAGHTTAWISVLTPAGALGTATPTSEDVAHAQLARAVRAVGRRFGTPALVAAP